MNTITQIPAGAFDDIKEDIHQDLKALVRKAILQIDNEEYDTALQTLFYAAVSSEPSEVREEFRQTRLTNQQARLNKNAAASVPQPTLFMERLGWLRGLQAGDTVLMRGKVWITGIVSKVTETQIVVGERRFRRGGGLERGGEYATLTQPTQENLEKADWVNASYAKFNSDDCA